MVWGSKRFERPRPWMRIVALVLAVLFALPLIEVSALISTAFSAAFATWVIRRARKNNPRSQLTD
jgi:membrane protein implicated in regulation of membrane protease activity